MKIYIFDEYDEQESESLVNRFFCYSEFTITKSIIESDFIFVPFDFGKFFGKRIIEFNKFINISKVYLENYWKFIFYSSLDNPWIMPFSGIWLRESVNKKINSNQSICVPYPISKQKFLVPNNIKRKLSFVGSLTTHPIRKTLIQYYYKLNGNENIIMIPRFEYQAHVYHDLSEIRKRQQEMIDLINKSYITICPRGAGMNSMRFFETLSFGRVPLLVSNDCVLPFEEKIKYSDFIYKTDEKNIFKIENLFSKSDPELIRRCSLSYKSFNENLIGINISKNLYLSLKLKRDQTDKTNLLYEENLVDYFSGYIEKYQECNEYYNIFSAVEFINSMTDKPNDMQLTLNDLMLNIKQVINTEMDNLRNQYIIFLEERFLYSVYS